MANTIQLARGTAAPASLAKSELAIRHRAYNATAANSSMLYIGEDADNDGVTVRSLGIGMAGDSGQGGVSIGNSMTFTGSSSITTSVSNAAVTIDVTDNTIGAAELNVSGNGTTSQFLRSDGDGTMTWASASVSVSDSTSSTAMPVVFHDESNNLHDDTGTFTYKPSTGLVAATTFSGAMKIGGHTMNDVDITAEWSDANDHLVTCEAINQKVFQADNTFTGEPTFNAGIILTGASFTLDGNTISGIDDSGEFTDNDVHIMTSAGVNDRIQSIGYTTNSGTVTSVGISPGTGLDAGSAITSSGNISVTLDLSELSDGTADIDSSDEVIYLDAGTEKRKAFSELKLSQFNNDSGWTANTGDITGVTAGTGLSGGGASGGVTLNVDASQTQITAVGTIGTGVWNGTALGASYVPAHDDLTGFVANEHINWTSASNNFSTTGSLTAGSIALADGSGGLSAHSSDDIILDSANGIILDATSASSGIMYKDGGTEIARFYNETNYNVTDFVIEHKREDEDIVHCHNLLFRC